MSAGAVTLAATCTAGGSGRVRIQSGAGATVEPLLGGGLFGSTFRILFAQEGEHDQVLLSLEAFSKKRQKVPRATIELAKRRLRDWRSQSRADRA